MKTLIYLTALFSVCLTINGEEEEDGHQIGFREVKDSSYGEVLVYDYWTSSVPDFGRVEILKDNQLFFEKVNRSEIYQSFRKLENIARVIWDVNPAGNHFYQVYLHRYSINGNHIYSNNVTGRFSFKYWYQNSTEGDYYGTWSYLLKLEHIELGLKGYNQNSITLSKANQYSKEIQFDCKFDLYNGKNISSLKLYKDGVVLAQYTALLPNSTNNYRNTGEFYLPEWLLNGRAYTTLSANKFSIVFSDIDSDLNGDYYCQMDYKSPTSSSEDTLKSNKFYLYIYG